MNVMDFLHIHIIISILINIFIITLMFCKSARALTLSNFQQISADLAP